MIYIFFAEHPENISSFFRPIWKQLLKKTLGPLNSARRQNKIPRRVRIQLRQSPQKRNGRQFGKPVLAKKLWKYTAFI